MFLHVWLHEVLHGMVMEVFEHVIFHAQWVASEPENLLMNLVTQSCCGMMGCTPVLLEHAGVNKKNRLTPVMT